MQETSGTAEKFMENLTKKLTLKLTRSKTAWIVATAMMLSCNPDKTVIYEGGYNGDVLTVFRNNDSLYVVNENANRVLTALSVQEDTNNIASMEQDSLNIVILGTWVKLSKTKFEGNIEDHLAWLFKIKEVERSMQGLWASKSSYERFNNLHEINFTDKVAYFQIGDSIQHKYSYFFPDTNRIMFSRSDYTLSFDIEECSNDTERKKEEIMLTSRTKKRSFCLTR